MLTEQIHLFSAVLEGPIQIIELDLTELHIFAIGIQKTLQDIHAAMAGEAQMTDPAVLFLLHQIAVDPVLLVIQVGVNIHFTDIVEEVKIEIVDAQLIQLTLKNLLHLSPV